MSDGACVHGIPIPPCEKCGDWTPDLEALMVLAEMVIEQRKNARADKTLDARHFRFALDCAADQAEEALSIRQPEPTTEIECEACNHSHDPWDPVHGYALCDRCPTGQCHAVRQPEAEPSLAQYLESDEGKADFADLKETLAARETKQEVEP